MATATVRNMSSSTVAKTIQTSRRNSLSVLPANYPTNNSNRWSRKNVDVWSNDPASAGTASDRKTCSTSLSKKNTVSLAPHKRSRSILRVRAKYKYTPTKSPNETPDPRSTIATPSARTRLSGKAALLRIV